MIAMSYIYQWIFMYVIAYLFPFASSIERTPVTVQSQYNPTAFFYSAMYNQANNGGVQYQKWKPDINFPSYKQISGTLPPRFCGFNTYTRECMDPDKLCPGRCVNFHYTFNTRYDCRCLAL
uniref:EGF-like domain-containing protein n=1 Tax=Rhabditophanes sp. KR3021 TaxID=114890 RepID=A0AC35U585_9BILA